MGADRDVELILMKKMLKYQKMAIAEQLEKMKSSTRRDPEEVVREYLTERAKEVLEYAKAQYPELTREVVKKLAELIEKGTIREQLDAVTLLNIFRSIGVEVKLPTRIVIREGGRTISISEKLREE
ncbi:MAG: double-stranded DNA-binding protein [Thermoprotei archaeon]|nr:MAG: double-stranded DNA-binding protein [Thermoprotei archaeon]